MNKKIEILGVLGVIMN